MKIQSSIQVVCAEYERRLKNSQVALTNWNKGRTEIHNSGRRGRDADNELRVLQGNFARAWALVQYHENDCEVCQRISNKDAVQSGTGTSMLPQLCH
jgi:hypothetical protein